MHVCFFPADALLLKLQHAYTAGIQSLIAHLGAGITKGTLLHNIALWVKSQLLTVPLTVKRSQKDSSNGL